MSRLTSGKEPDPAHGEIIGEGAVNRDKQIAPFHPVIQGRS